MSLRKLTIALLAITVLAFATMPLVAQTAVTGDLTGTITDQSNAVVSGATVTLKNGETGTSQTASTNQSGIYHFALLTPGEYTVSAKAPNMNEVSRRVIIAVGQVTNTSIQLGVAGGKEILEVTSDVPLLKTDNANIATNYSPKQLDLVPNPGNDITDYAQTAPGVTINTANGGGYGNFSAFGMPATANLFTVNGNDEMDPYLNLNNSGATNLLLGTNELQEVAVVSNGYTGQYGRQAGAQIDASTKYGTNNWHGNAQYWWNGSSMNANDWFNNHSGTPIGFSNNNQWAASVGGPIKKDKLFFFVDTEGLRYILSTSQQVFVPTPAFQTAVIAALNGSQGAPQSVPFYKSIFNLYNTAPGVNRAVPLNASNNPSDAFGCGDVNQDNVVNDPTNGGIPSAGFTIPELAGFGNPATNLAGIAGGKPCLSQFRSNVGALSKEWLLSGRVDYNLGANDKIYFRAKEDHGLQPTNIDPINPVFNATSNQPQYEGQMNETHSFTSNLVNQFILSGSWYSAIFKNPDTAAARNAYPGELISLDFPLTTLGGADISFPQGRNVTQYQVVDDVSWTKGNHTFKFGGNYRRNDVTDRSFGTLTVPRQRIFSTSDFASGVIDQVRERFPVSDRQPIALYSLGAYLQDEWRVSNNLKFTMALRIDHNSNAVCQHDCVSTLNNEFTLAGHDPNLPFNQVISSGGHQVFPDVEKVVIQPRFGFAWTPLGSKSTVIRGGIGQFSDLYPATLVDRFTRNAPQDTQFTLSNGYWLSPNQPAIPGTITDNFTALKGCNTAFLNTFKTGGNVATFLDGADPTFGCASPDFQSVTNKLRNPKYVEWNFEIQQALGSKTSLSVNYVGSHGYDLFVSNSGVNAYIRCYTASVLSGGLFPTAAAGACPAGFTGFNGFPLANSAKTPGGNALRAPDPHFNNVTDLTNEGISNYNGLTFSVTRKVGYGFQGAFNYTWSHSLDDVSNGGILPFSLNDSQLSQIDPFNLRRFNYSNSDYDVRHNFTANYVWELPYKSSSRAWNYLIGGWSMSGTIFYHTGYPYTVTNSGVFAGGILNGSNNGAVPTPVVTGNPIKLFNYASAPGLAMLKNMTGISSSCESPSVPCLTDANFFSNSGQTTLGNIPRNFFRAAPYFNTDFSVNKSFPITERVTFRFGVNAYNILNHPNFASPDGDIHSGTFGSILSTVTPPTSPYGAFTGSAVSGRILQLSGKVVF
jgi:hypothetical protein